MNRYGRKMVGKTKQKKRFIPRKYNSYAEYVSISKEQQDALDALHPSSKEMRSKQSGCKPYYAKYWRGSSEWYRGGGTMSALKYQANRLCRNYYRQEIAMHMRDRDHDVVVRTKFGDIWDFT